MSIKEAYMNEIATTTATTPQSTNLGSLIERYTAYLDTTAKTIETYSRALKQLFLYLQDNDINNPQREDIIAFRDNLKATGHKPTTVQNYITAVRIFFTWTAQEGLYPNIAEHIKGAKLSREHKKDSLTSDQIEEVLLSIDHSTLQGKRDFAIFSLMVNCGLRDIEVSRARVEDMRAIGNITALFVQRKGREERAEYVIVPKETEKAIRAYLRDRGSYKDSDPLFSSLSNNSLNKELSTRSISGLIKACLINAGYNSSRLTAHSLRHTAATLALEGGEEVTKVQEALGHSSVMTTMNYVHSLEKAKNTCSNTVARQIKRGYEWL